MTIPTISINNGMGNMGSWFDRNFHSDGTPKTEAGLHYAMARYYTTDEGKEYLKQQKKDTQQIKAALLGARKASKSVGYNSSTVFGGGSTNENQTGITLG